MYTRPSFSKMYTRPKKKKKSPIPCAKRMMRLVYIYWILPIQGSEQLEIWESNIFIRKNIRYSQNNAILSYPFISKSQKNSEVYHEINY